MRITIYGERPSPTSEAILGKITITLSTYLYIIIDGTTI